MCIIAYKPEGVRFPSRDILMNCWDGNRDGAGYMVAYGGSVHIRKGFMDFESLMDSLDRDRAKTGDAAPYVIHFRIQTQGGVRKDCCHPFPLSRDMDDLRLLRCKTDIGIAHNGIISLTSRGRGSKVSYSDTMEFITEYASKIIKGIDWHKDRDKVELIDKLCGGRLAILGKDGHCELVGDWIKDGGIYYSNSSYRSYWRYEDPVALSEWDEWDEFKTNSGYAFEEDFCPFIMDGDPNYCEDCMNCMTCKNLEELWLDDEDGMDSKWTG